MKKLARWFVGVAIVAAAVAGFVLLAVQVVLWDGRVPRRLVEDGIAEGTGLRTRVVRVSTGWMGESVLEDVTLWLPLEDEPLATVPRLRVGHSELLALVLGWPLSIRTAEVERPVIHLREGGDGTWNIQRAAELLELAQRGSTGEGARGRVRLPDLDIPSATLEIRRMNTRALTVPLAIAAETDEAGGWGFAVTAEQRGWVKGRVAPGGDWLHEADFDVVDIGEVIGLWLDDVPSPMLARGTWRGRAVNGGISGSVRLDEVAIGQERASGNVGIESGGASGGEVGVVRLRPAALEVSSARIPGGAVVVRSGEVLIGDNSVSTKGVVAEWMGSTAVLDGTWDGAKRGAELAAAWSGELAGLEVSQQGSLRATAELPRAGVRRLDLQVATAGLGFGGSWEGEFSATLSGTSTERLDAALHASTLKWTDAGGTVDLAGVRAAVEGAWPVVRLRSLEVPGAEVRVAKGEVDLESLAWSGEIDLGGWDVPRVGLGAVEIRARARGEADRLEVEGARIAAGGVEVEASGRYGPGENPPVSVQWAAVLPAGTGGAPVELGRWGVEGRTLGSVSPLNLQMDGSALGTGVQGPAQALPPIEVTWRGGVTGVREGERGVEAWVHTDAFALLDGQCVVRAEHGGADRAGSITISVSDMPLESVARVAGAPVSLGGALAAELEFGAPEWDLSRLVVSGAWSVDHPVADGYLVDRGQGKIRTRDGRVDFTDIVLELGEGRASGSVGFNLSEARKLDVEMASRGWPVEIDGTGVGVVIDAGVNVSIDVLERRATGTVEVSAPVFVNGERYGDVAVGATLDGRTITAERIVADLAGGSISGSASVSFDEPLTSRADLVWEGLELAALVAPWVEREGTVGAMTGTLGGSLRVAPAGDARAPEPLKIDLELRPREATWRGGTLGDAVFAAYAGPHRVVLDESTIAFAGGEIAVWSRVSRHGDEPFVHVDATIRRLDLELLLPIVDPELPASPGLIGGRVSFGGYVREPRRTFGVGTLQIEQADLVELPVVSHLYGLLNLSPSGRQPTGRGRVDLRLEDYTLIASRAEFFNRGTDIIASARVEDLLRGGESPITGVAIARVRPLRDVGLPFMRDLDDILTGVQASGASVRIGGTLENRVIRPAPFEEVGAFMRGIFGDSGR